MSPFRRLALALVTSLALTGAARAQIDGGPSCAAATPIAPGSYWGELFDHYDPIHDISVTDYDFFRITVPTGMLLRATVRRTQLSGAPATMSVTATLLPCFGGQSVPVIGDGTLFSFSHANLTSEPVTLGFGTWIWVDASGIADGRYDLTVELLPEGCPDAADDAFEPVGTATSRPIGFGTVSGLRSSWVDDDAYSLWLPRGTTVVVTMDLNNALGDLDLIVSGESGTLDSSQALNQEQVAYTNTSSVDPVSPILVRVAPKSWAYDVCNVYSLDLEVLATSLGTIHCPTSVNGSGMEARLLPYGSDSVSANDLRFVAQLFPGANPGVLFAGTAQTQVPFGDGWICAGGSVVRLRATSASGGAAFVQPDFTTPQGALITPGTTWNFQLLYRDLTLPGGAGFNLTNAVAIPMTP